MTNDPIVDEVHRTRAKLLAESAGDLDRYMDRLQVLEKTEQRLVIKSVDDLRSRVKTVVS